jgi:outer membrane protein
MPVESGKPSAVGGDVKLNNTSVPEIDFSYFFNEHFASELILATTTHTARANNTSLNNLDLGSVTLLPPTLLAQYHQQMGKFKPYAGAGLNYTVFFGADNGVAKKVTYSNSMGYALQIGADYEIAENVYINFDIKKLWVATNVHVETYSNGNVHSKVHIDPYLIGLGLGYRF